MLLSAARSELFNGVLARRVAEGAWDAAVDGDVWMLDGSRSQFGPEPFDEVLAERLARFDIHPTAPLWGRGELATTGPAHAMELEAIDGPVARRLRAGLEQAGLRQERRATRLHPDVLTWDWLEEGALQIDFALPPGTYATVVLAELGVLRGHAGDDRPSE